MKPFDYNKYLKNNPLLKESINEIAEAATTELKLKGPDQDELIDAIAFLNNGIGKGNQKVKLPFGNNTLKALDKDGKKDGAAFSIRVKPTKSGAEYIKSVNDFLDDHGFGCKLTGTKVNEAKNNPLLKEEPYASFKNNKIYISRPKQSATIKGTKPGTKELIYTLEKLQSIYDISKEDMEIIYRLINNVLK